MTPVYNYTRADGIDSVAGAVIFAVLYLPLLLFFTTQAVLRPTYVYIVTAFFCAIRTAAFILRAFLAGVASEGENLKLLITFEILYNVGFFGLLYSAYILVLDRGRLSDVPLPDGPISRVTRRPQLFRIVLAAAVIIGITGAIESATGSTQTTINIGNTLRKFAIYILLALCILVAYQTVLLIRAMASCGTYKTPNRGGLGATYGMYILCIIAFLLLAREAFFTATSNNLTKQNDENWWYPFGALTELLAVVLLAAPGLVPLQDELPS